MERKRTTYVSQRRYYQTDFARPSFYDPTPAPRPPPGPPPGPPPDPTPNPPPDPPPNPSPNPTPGPSSRGKLPVTIAPRALKKISTLTPEQLEKARMLAASYEIDDQINQ